MLETISLYILPIMILAILCTAVVKKVPVYEEFIEGAKDGFKVAVSIIPYLVAIIVAVSMFKASGILDFAKNFAGSLIPADIIPIIATRSLSGSATLGLFSDIVKVFGQIYDKDGAIASEGNICESWLDCLLQDEYYFIDPPKTLVLDTFKPVFHKKLEDIVEVDCFTNLPETLQ